MDAYAMESMGYVTAGILDSVVNPDAAVESAIVKVHESLVHVACISSGNGKSAHLKQCFDFIFRQNG